MGTFLAEFCLNICHWHTYTHMLLALNFKSIYLTLSQTNIYSHFKATSWDWKDLAKVNPVTLFWNAFKRDTPLEYWHYTVCHCVYFEAVKDWFALRAECDCLTEFWWWLWLCLKWDTSELLTLCSMYVACYLFFKTRNRIKWYKQ